MEVRKIVDKRIRCDMGGCKNNATYAFSKRDVGRRTFVCRECAEELNKFLAGEFVPESPESIFLKKEKEKKVIKK